LANKYDEETKTKQTRSQAVARIVDRAAS